MAKKEKQFWVIEGVTRSEVIKSQNDTRFNYLRTRNSRRIMIAVISFLTVLVTFSSALASKASSYVGALGGLANGQIAGLQQLGVGLAFGILIDATIVRTLLLPSIMTILGKWSWWLPAPVAKAAFTQTSDLKD